MAYERRLSELRMSTIKCKGRKPLLSLEDIVSGFRQTGGVKAVRLAAAIGSIVILASLFLFGFLKPTEPPLVAPGVTFSSQRE